jgi:hypothetical protein
MRGNLYYIAGLNNHLTGLKQLPNEGQIVSYLRRRLHTAELTYAAFPRDHQ